jgi:hypothetical protein
MSPADISLHITIVVYEALYMSLNIDGVRVVFITSRKRTQASPYIDDLDVHKPRFS